MSTTAPVADQAPVQSVEERVYAQFNDGPEEPVQASAPSETPDDEVEGEAAEPAEEQDVEIEWKGAQFRVPKDLEEPVSLARDYTRKTQELADNRRQVEYERKAIDAQREEIEFARTLSAETEQLRSIDSLLKQLNNVDVDELPFEEGIAHDRKVARLERQKAALAQDIDAKRQEFTQKQRQTLESLKSQARELLSKQYGGLDDAAFESLRAHAKTFGYTDQDVEMISLDPRAQSMLYKAWKYDQLQANKSAAVQKATSPAIKPGSSNPMPQAVRDKLALRKAIKAETDSGRRAKLIERDLANRFS